MGTIPKPKPKGKPKPKSKRRPAPTEQGDDAAPHTDEQGDIPTPTPDPEGGKRRPKTDPAVAARLQQLQNQKDLLLTTTRWQDRVKSLNVEVSQSVVAADQYDETKGCLVFCFI